MKTKSNKKGTIMKTKSNKKGTYWYKTYYENCPICGDGEVIRERVYGKKPKDERKRHEHLNSGACYGCTL